MNIYYFVLTLFKYFEYSLESNFTSTIQMIDIIISKTIKIGDIVVYVAAGKTINNNDWIKAPPDFAARAPITSTAALPLDFNSSSIGI